MPLLLFFTKMKQFKYHVLASLLLFVSAYVSAHDFRVGSFYYNFVSEEDLTCAITFQGTDIKSAIYGGDIEIPSYVTFDGDVYTVTQIDGHAFDSCTKLTKITIPNTVETISWNAFEGCSGLSDITIPNSVKYIYTTAFKGCTNLKSIIIPNSVIIINWNAFENCTNLESVILGNGLHNISAEAFKGCSSLKSIVLPTGLKYIGDNAFSGCNLKEINIPDSVESIGKGAFDGCKLEKIRFDAQWCKEAGSYSSPILGNYSFLKTLIIGSEVEFIPDNAFLGAKYIEQITSLNDTPPTCGLNVFSEMIFKPCNVHVPKAAISAYENSTTWGDFINIIPLDAGEDEQKKCEKPTIELENGTLLVSGKTKRAQCVTSITSSDWVMTTNDEIDLTGVYNVTSYATRNGYINSDIATATIVWTNPIVAGTNVISMATTKPLLLQSNGSVMTIDGLAVGDILELFDTNGILIDKVIASSESITAGKELVKGTIYIVKIGERSIKYQF